jgi:RNA polymerase sigma factor for flagellar operon FliA
MRAGAMTPAERDALVLEHMPLLKHVVGRMGVPRGMEREDLAGYGMIGLLQAADSWDPARGLKFSTYAYPKIRGAVLDELRRRDALTRHGRETLRAIDACVQRRVLAGGMAPTPEEIAAELELDAEQVEACLAEARAAHECSLDGESGDGAGGLAALVADPRCDDPQGSAEFEEQKQLLVRAIEELPEQEKSVVTLYWAEGLLLKEIAEILGVTESRVSQIHGAAIYRLNRRFARTNGGKA